MRCPTVYKIKHKTVIFVKRFDIFLFQKIVILFQNIDFADVHEIILSYSVHIVEQLL